MTAVGQTLQIEYVPTVARCPLRFESDRIDASPRNDVMGQQR